MTSFEDYITDFINTSLADPMEARRIPIGAYTPPGDLELLHLANKYHYGISVEKNLSLAFELYAYAHHKDEDVTASLPVTQISIMQYLELAREIEAGPCEAIKRWGAESEGDYYLWECDLIDIAVRSGYKWTSPYLVDELMWLIGEADTGSSLGIELYSLRFSRVTNALTKVFPKWDEFCRAVKNSSF